MEEMIVDNFSEVQIDIIFEGDKNDDNRIFNNDDNGSENISNSRHICSCSSNDSLETMGEKESRKIAQNFSEKECNSENPKQQSSEAAETTERYSEFEEIGF